jgi:hypothetical protein
MVCPTPNKEIDSGPKKVQSFFKVMRGYGQRELLKFLDGLPATSI